MWCPKCGSPTLDATVEVQTCTNGHHSKLNLAGGLDPHEPIEAPAEPPVVEDPEDLPQEAPAPTGNGKKR